MPKRKCKFTAEMQNKLPCFKKGRDEWEAECLMCKAGTFVSLAHKGINDLQSHVNSEKHKRAVQEEGSSMKMTHYFVKPGSEAEDVSAAEGAYAFHTVKHHGSFLSMDCSSVLLKKTFPDSEVARKFSSARTKTAAIIKAVLAPHSVDVALKSLKENEVVYCGIATDGSNHDALKLFPVIIQYFDWKNGGLQSKLIEFKNTPNETADTIAKYVKETLDKHGLTKKCVAFTGDNCNTMFGGLKRNEEGNNVFANLKKMLEKSLIGVGCPAHILNNCVHHGAERMDIDIENIINKIYQYFHIYTVRTEKLKEYCEFAEVEYRKLLSHSKSRWLSLFPGITRLIEMFPALQSFFLSQEQPPTVIRKFFENEMSEIYLWHMHSLMAVFHTHIQTIEKESNSVVEVLRNLESVCKVLAERKNQHFMSLKVKGLIAQKRTEGKEEECNRFCVEVVNLYSRCLEYLGKWMKPLEEFSCFKWMVLSEIPNWTDVEPCVIYLIDKGVELDDVKCFDQVCNLRQFVERNKSDEDFSKLPAHKKWTRYFEASKNIECHSELLRIAQFFFAVTSHNANVERVFSLMQSQWTKERNKLSVDTMKGILTVQYNYRETSCVDFFNFLKSNKELLKNIRSTEKYASAHQATHAVDEEELEDSN